MKRRGKIKLLILDFCNIKKWGHIEIYNLQIKHGIIYTVEGSRRGFEKHCFSKRDPMKRPFVLVEDREIIDFKSEFEKEFPDKLKPFWVLPSEEESEELWNYLRDSQEKFKHFLNKCMANSLNIEFINEIIDNFRYVGFTLIPSKKIWAPNITYSEPYLASIEDYIYWEILKIFLTNNAGQIFPNTKKCSQCDDYYIAKTDRPDQKYCRNKCRYNWHNRRRIESGAAREYKRQRRERGLDQ